MCVKGCAEGEVGSYDEKTKTFFCRKECKEIDGEYYFTYYTQDDETHAVCLEYACGYDQYMERVMLPGTTTHSYIHCMDSCVSSTLGKYYYEQESGRWCVGECKSGYVRGLTCIAGPCDYLSYTHWNTYSTVEDLVLKGPFTVAQRYCTYGYSCPDYVPALINGTCMWTCPDDYNYFWANGECVRWCKSQWFTVQYGKRICQTTPCQNFVKTVVPDTNTAMLQCVDDCSKVKGALTVVETGECATTCPADYPLQEGEQCVLTCSAGMFKEVLDEETSTVTKVCITDKSECRVMENTSYGQKCIADVQCSGAIYIDEYNQTHCVMICPSQSPYLQVEKGKKYCLAECDYISKITEADLQQYATYQCVPSCGNSQVFYSQDGANFCDDRCPAGMIESYGQCVTQCPSHLFLSNDTETPKCVQSCAPKFYYVNEVNGKTCWASGECDGDYPFMITSTSVTGYTECVDVCPGTEPYFYKQKCYNKCPAGIEISYTLANGTEVRYTDNTFHYNNEYECVEKCNSTYQFANGQMCDSQCSQVWTYNETISGQPEFDLLQQWRCQDSCGIGVPLFIDNADDRHCVDVCDASYSYSSVQKLR